MFNFSCWVALAILLIHEPISCIMNHLVTHSWEFLLVPWKRPFVFGCFFFLNSFCTLCCFPNSQSIFYFYLEDLLHYMDQSMPMCSTTNQILGKSRAIKWFSLAFPSIDGTWTFPWIMSFQNLVFPFHWPSCRICCTFFLCQVLSRFTAEHSLS